MEPDSFRRLGPDFSGKTVKGVGFDREVLLEAGINDADGFAAVSSGDNSNILSARVVRETFAVDNVVARIYDPGRAEVYERLGIPTVATVRWTADQMLRRLLPAGSEPQWRDPSGSVRLMEVHVDRSWVGRTIEQIEAATGARVPLPPRRGHGPEIRHNLPGRRPGLRGRCRRTARGGRGQARRTSDGRLSDAGRHSWGGQRGPVDRRGAGGERHDILLIDRDPHAIKAESLPAVEWLLADACELSSSRKPASIPAMWPSPPPATTR